MKYLCLLLLWLVTIASDTFGQEPQREPKSYTREALLKRSHGQKIGAWIMLGGGIIAIAAVSSGNPLDFGTTATVAVFGGASAILGSIPLFLASRRNKRRAHRMQTSLNLESIPKNLSRQKFAVGYPAVAVRVNF